MIVESLNKNETHLLRDLQPEGWGDLTPIFDFYTSTDFCYPIKIKADNKIIGIGSAIIHNEVAWLGHIIVHQAYRNKGLGKRITQSLIDEANMHKCSTIYLLATELGAYVYEKLGFINETEYLFYKIEKKSSTFSKSAAILPYNEKWKAKIEAMDFLISGENRIHHTEKYLKDAFLYVENNTLEGYYLPTFGEGLILANIALAGTELMKLHLETKEKIVFPVDNIAAQKFMSENNYPIASRAKRMRLGEKRDVHFSRIYNRIGGYLG